MVELSGDYVITPYTYTMQSLCIEILIHVFGYTYPKFAIHVVLDTVGPL